MDSKRRDFIWQSGLLSGAFFLSEPFRVLESASSRYLGINHITNGFTIIHTNDLHNRIDAFSSGLKNGYGGLKNIQKRLSKYKQQYLLLDAGDFLDQSAGYTDHKKMILLMNQTGYKAATLGNHELSNGQEYFASLLSLINFPVVNCNYSFDHPYLSKKIKPYTVMKVGKFRIGVTGVGVGNDHLKEHVQWHHPYECGNRIAALLKKQYDCNFVICLSHIGYKSESGSISNLEFASESENIDLIISGHGNTVVPELRGVRNRKKVGILVSHGAPGGLIAKQIDFGFNDLGLQNSLDFKNIVPGSPEGYSAYLELKRISTEA